MPQDQQAQRSGEAVQLPVSIVSAVDDHPPDLDIWFQAIGNQSFPANQYEAIVIDATHVGQYEEALARFQATASRPPAIRYCRIPRGGRSKALNHGLALARGRLIVFLGDDYVPRPGFTEAHWKFHQQHREPEAVGIGPAILTPKLRSPFAVWIEESGELYGVPFRADMTDVREDFFYVGNASVKRDFLDRAGNFDERYTHHAWDDFELGCRLRTAGMRAQFIPEARADHIHDIDLAERQRAMRHAGEAARAYERDHPGPHPWTERTLVSPLRYRLRMLAAKARLARTGTDGDIIAWWQVSLDAAFAEGYRQAS